MKEHHWPKCIVTAFDLIGTRSLAGAGRGSDAMIRMHRHANEKISFGLPLHSNGYIWNDSVLLLSYKTEPTKRGALLAELSQFKISLEQACGLPTYAISVMGLAFPQETDTPTLPDGSITQQPRAVILKTSSWAMANCFLIEKKLGHHRADWYIDSRITTDVNLPKPFESQRIELLPTKKQRTIHMFKGCIHTEGERFAAEDHPRAKIAGSLGSSSSSSS